MKDKYERKINYMRLSVTDLCNYRCQYCMPSEGIKKCAHDDILSLEDFEEIVRAGATLGIDKVRITGGEPLVRCGLTDLIENIHGIPEIRDIAMTTNGSLLAGKAEMLKKAGLKRLNISLDTLRPDRFQKITRRGNLYDVLGGIKEAQEAGFDNIKINTVLMGGVNDDEIRDFAAFAMENAFTVRFIELMPMGECANWDRKRFLKAEKVLEVLPELRRVTHDGVSEVFALPGGRGRIGLIRPLGNRFCQSCNRIRITSDGMLKPCLHSDMEIPLKGLKGEALRDVLIKGIGLKPEHHAMIENGVSDAARNMNRIGG